MERTAIKRIPIIRSNDHYLLYLLPITTARSPFKRVFLPIPGIYYFYRVIQSSKSSKT